MGLNQSRIKTENIDADGDGIITRSEVHNFVRDEIERKEEVQNKRMEEWKAVYEEKLSAKDESIQNLKAILESQLSEKDTEIEELKKSYDDLHSRYSEMLENVRKENYSPHLPAINNISQSSVERTVEEILADPNLNLKKVPDWIERKLYFNIIWIVLLVIQRAVSSLQIKALGHEFGVTMNPDE